ncbi:thioesterase II family protein [Streptomyces axinellae]|uniref:Alpha/beta fold hydrolase n=1 Tax=Streptomyces axinellae TaxID=552788 RepID=A0ABP6CF97_9ACTN
MNTAERWIRRYSPELPGAAQLVFFPHAGGSASYYRPFCLALADRFEVSALQYPGRQDRFAEPCVTDLDSLADHVFARLRTMTGRPLAFFGHSMGALLAYETARRFEEELGISPVRLFASGRSAPSRPGETAVDLTGDRLLTEIRALGGTDPQLLDDEAMLELLLQPLRADYQALQTYRFSPGPPLRCPVTALSGASDPRTREDGVAAWREHTQGEFDMRVFPGGHFFLSEHVEDVTALVTERLSGVSQSG